MSYFQGFLIPVAHGKKDAYARLAIETAPFFAEFGAQRTVEGWGAEVPRGERTDMFRAVDAQEDENVVFSWIEWASEAACSAAHDAMTKDARMEAPQDLPFNGARMIYAGFDVLGASGAGGVAGFVQGYVAPVATGRRNDYAAMAATMRDVAIACGALRAVDGWSTKIERGEVTDFKRAVSATDDEAIAFGFVEWASRQAFDEGTARMREHDHMAPPDSAMPVDGTRLIFGGFDVLLDTNREENP